MKLLVLSRYDAAGASSRYRALQYFDYLELQGVEITFRPLLDHVHLQRAFKNKKKSFSYLFYRYLKRALFLLFQKSKYDLAYITDGELFPFLPFGLEQFFLPKKYVVDYDDAVFHYYDMHRWKKCRQLLSGKIPNIMRRAQHVIVGNDYVYQKAMAFGAKKITAIPTVVDMEKYKPLGQPGIEEKEVVIGWVGSPTTLRHLALIDKALIALSKKIKIRVSVIGGIHAIPGVQMECENWPQGWNEAEEIALLQKVDIGIMPLIDEPWERGKCGFKLIKYMSCAKPMVASPVSINAQIVESGKNGYLADSLEEWEECLFRLAVDPELRTTMGRCARDKGLQEYSLERAAPLLLTILQSAMQGEGSQSG